MPHVIVKLWPGKSEARKSLLAERIAQAVMDVLDYRTSKEKRNAEA
jgi:4-oxalocrotonate tautomerase